MNKILALIPARSGSKGVVNKNMKKINGKTLLQWSIAACLKSKLIKQTIVSTDSEIYRNHVMENGAEAPFLRPANISTDTSTDYDFISHCLHMLISC